MSRWISSATWFYVWHIDDSGWRYWLPTRETGINSMCDATHFYVYKWMWSGTWFCRIMILRVTWLSHVSDMTDHPRMKRDPFLYEARLISMCEVDVERDMILCVTWLVRMGGKTDYPDVWWNSFRCGSRLISMCAGGCRARYDSTCDMTRSYGWQDWLPTCVVKLISIWGTTHFYVCRWM